MNKKWKAKWLTALRGKRYKQGQFLLYTKSSNKYCCLGVLCRIAKIPSVITENGVFYGERSDLLDDKLLGKFGLTMYEQRTLAGNNDTGDPFKDIADYIEHNL